MRAQIHDGNAMGDVAHQPQIMGDEDDGEAEPLLQLDEQIDDLGLDRDVERRDELVGDQAFGLERKARAMPMRWRWPPLEFVGVAGSRIGGQADHREQLPHARRDLRLPAASRGRAIASASLSADAHARIERAVGILEHHLDARL